MTEQLILIFVVTFLVRIVSVLTGGGGLLLIPMLIFMGIPPSIAIATNRLGALGQSFSIFEFHRQKQVKWKLGLQLIIPTIIGAVAGSLIVVSIDQDLLKTLLGVIILFCIPLTLFKSKLGIVEKKIRKLRFNIGIGLTVLAGFMGGLFASSGIWFTYLFFFFGLTMLQTAATRKIVSFVIILSTLGIFIVNGLVHWQIGGVMLIASLLGSIIGAKIWNKKGNKVAKNLFLIVVILSALKMIFG